MCVCVCVCVCVCWGVIVVGADLAVFAPSFLLYFSWSLSCFSLGILLLLLFQEPDIRRVSLISYLVMSSESVGLFTVLA